MCLALYKPANRFIPKAHLRIGWQINDDGGGFMWASDGQLYIEKGYFDFNAFYKAFKRAEKAFPKSDFVLHLRLATSGLKNINNCHPIMINNKVAFVHNGILIGFGCELKSDSIDFGEQILQKLPEDFIISKGYQFLLDKYCQEHFSKMIFMNNKGKAYIANIDGGDWENGIWYSNTSYKQNIVSKNPIVWTEPKVIFDGSTYNRGLKYVGASAYYVTCCICNKRLRKMDTVAAGNVYCCKDCVEMLYAYSPYCKICESDTFIFKEQCIKCGRKISKEEVIIQAVEGY